MGYYTDFEIVISSVTVDHAKEIKYDLEKISDYTFDLKSYDEGEIKINAHHKWYEYKQNMNALSRLYPDILFTVSGQGEEQGDVWRRYFKGGLTHSAEVSFTPFDPALLVLDEGKY